MKETKQEQRDQLVAKMRQDEQQRESGYREQALKLFPHVCGRCAREFEGKSLRELTVHHKDHNHDNNPPNGSNWDLLCIYCHDHEHSKYSDHDRFGADPVARLDDHQSATYNPFADLAKMMKK